MWLFNTPVKNKVCYFSNHNIKNQKLKKIEIDDIINYILPIYIFIFVIL